MRDKLFGKTDNEKNVKYQEMMKNYIKEIEIRRNAATLIEKENIVKNIKETKNEEIVESKIKNKIWENRLRESETKDVQEKVVIQEIPTPINEIKLESETGEERSPRNKEYMIKLIENIKPEELKLQEKNIYTFYKNL
jgi:hypothetical protein